MAKYPDQKHIDMLDRAAAHLRAVLDEVPEDAEDRRVLELALERAEQFRESTADHVHGTGSASSDTAVELGGSTSPEGGV